MTLREQKQELQRRIKYALQMAETSVDGGHHKQWTIDQMVRALTGCPIIELSALDCNGKKYTYDAQGESAEYKEWVREHKDGDDGPDTYDWETGTPP